MKFTSEDFEAAIESAGSSALEGSPYFYDSIAYTALRIASAVMRPGVIEREMYERLDDPAAGVDELAAVIRSALTV